MLDLKTFSVDGTMEGLETNEKNLAFSLGGLANGTGCRDATL
jgi:hypothetical protein